jgi:peptidoglycan/xylan/chitin deacetylase (PgdA/CDA1 family)
MPLLLFLLGAGAAVLSHLAPFPMLLDVTDRTVWRMAHAPDDRVIYLTYDDGPNPAATPALLDVLAREQASATFFVIDRHLTDETASIVARMFDEGHAVALHSHTRRKMFMRPQALADTLQAAAGRIERLAGGRPCRAFRPHGGGRSGEMLAGLERIDYTLVGWTFRLWDWDWFRRPDPERLADRLARRVSPGAIVVIHDGHHENPRADRQYAVYAVRATALLVPQLRERGFRFGKICGADGVVQAAEGQASGFGLQASGHEPSAQSPEPQSPGPKAQSRKP